jgi:Leucine-rich repeat (LRR) protein
MCTSLEVLRLSHNKLSGSIPCEMQNLVMLNEIDFNNNVQLMGDLKILSLPNLRYVDLDGTQIEVNCSNVCQEKKSVTWNVTSVSICLCN